MVTPTSIFQEHAAEADLAASADLRNTGLGDISKSASRSPADTDSAIEDIEENNNESEVDDMMIASNEDGSDATRDLGNDQETEEVDNRTVFERNMNATHRSAGPTTQIWLPLTFPPVPQKGEFDVSRLKNSQYFFS